MYNSYAGVRRPVFVPRPRNVSYLAFMNAKVTKHQAEEAALKQAAFLRAIFGDEAEDVSAEPVLLQKAS